MRVRNHARRRVTVGSLSSSDRRRSGRIVYGNLLEPIAAEATRLLPSALQEAAPTRRSELDPLVATDATSAPARTRRMRKVCEDSRACHERSVSEERGPLQPLLATSAAQARASTLSPTKQPRTLARCASGDEGMRQVARNYYCLLQSAFAPEDQLDETNWLTSTLIDLVLWRLAMQYTDVHFLATDFCHLHLPSVMKQAGLQPSTATTTTDGPTELYHICDVLGRSVEYSSTRPIVFVANVSHIHWNLLRVQFDPVPELQLFEPMGRLSSRSGISFRSIPRCVVEWLDACYPQDLSWKARSVSAITRPQQVSGYDCGVACLLYADKCGQGQAREVINASTDQLEISAFRTVLQRQLQSELEPPLLKAHRERERETDLLV